MSITRVKICGITRPDDALLAAELGADAIGLNFVGGPRMITVDQANAILEELPAFVTPVGLTLGDVSANAQSPTIDELLAATHGRVPITTFQLYGREHPMGFFGHTAGGFSWWCVVHVASKSDLVDAGEFMDLYELHRPTAVVFDTATREAQGGTGKTFDWNLIAAARAEQLFAELPPIILAGGLTPDNVADAIRIARPYAVDVASGVEIPGKPGIKDPLKLRDFIQAAKGA